MNRQSKIIEIIRFIIPCPKRERPVLSLFLFLSNLGINAKRGSEIYQLCFFKNIFDKGCSIKNIAKFPSSLFNLSIADRRSSKFESNINIPVHVFSFPFFPSLWYIRLVFAFYSQLFLDQIIVRNKNSFYRWFLLICGLFGVVTPVILACGFCKYNQSETVLS